MPPLMPMPMEGVQSEGCESWEYCSWHSTCLARGVSWLCRDLLGLKSEQEWRHSPTGKSSTNSAMYGARCHNPGISIVSASTCIYMCQKACVKSTCMGVFCIVSKCASHTRTGRWTSSKCTNCTRRGVNTAGKRPRQLIQIYVPHAAIAITRTAAANAPSTRQGRCGPADSTICKRKWNVCVSAYVRMRYKAFVVMIVSCQ